MTPSTQLHPALADLMRFAGFNDAHRADDASFFLTTQKSPQTRISTKSASDENFSFFRQKGLIFFFF